MGNLARLPTCKIRPGHENPDIPSDLDEDPTTMHLHFSTHDFRRTFATRLLNENVDNVLVQKMMGHASVTTTAQYDRRADEERKRIAQKIKL